MLEVDGSAGGGQLLRSSVSLSAVTGQPVRVTNIRGSRPDPGLKPQHLTAVEVLAEVCGATVEGLAGGAETIEFDPGDPQGGEFEASVGTAGSLTLIFDTLLPLAVTLEDPLSVTVTGGTAVKWAPPFSTYQAVKLPLCREFGLTATAERHRSGYYPAGGGVATLYLAPSSLSPLSLTDRGSLRGARIYSQCSTDLTESNVAQRQAETAHRRLDDAGIEVLERQVTATTADSAGSVVTIELEYEESVAGFDALGEPGKSAEAVAGDAVEDALSFREGNGAVDDHLADQLLVVLALAGGELSIPHRTDHVDTSLELLKAFGFGCSVESGEGDSMVAQSR
jgi:RNA 3'-terminal phosphate cyclase (ATP)